MHADREMRAEGRTGLSYELDGRFSVVVLPHKTTHPVRRKRPFSSIAERLARAYGPEALPLLEDPEFLA